MDLSIIIVSWNVREYLEKALSSIYKFTKDVNFEVFVVDNNSSDGSAQMVNSRFPQARLLENSENTGFAAANNRALKESSGRYILFLNPDTELVSNALKDIIAFMDTHTDASGAGCRLIYPDGSTQKSCRRFPNVVTDLMESLYLSEKFPDSPVFDYYRMGGWMCDTLKIVDQPAGAFLILSRDMLDLVGYFDERFFIYYEDVDLCLRVRKSGGKVYFVPQISVIHHANKSARRAGADNHRYYVRSKLLYFSKNASFAAMPLLYINLILRTALNMLVFRLTFRIFRRPRGYSYGDARAFALVEWREYVNFLRTLGRRKHAG